MSEFINITLDNKQHTVEKNQTIIQVADKLGVYIPRFCYHPKLSIAANCRMCLVEIANAPKPMPACATYIADGMVIYTRSKDALKAQQDVMSFLLINHPLDCPICDQGGECDLQDLALAYGKTVGGYDQQKRAVVDEDLGPLVATEMTRCIHCTRCVRFGEEIAGMPELGVMSRGNKAYIGTYLNKKMKSELSGNVIDLCPVGALTAKPSRFTGRSWTYKQFAHIARHDFIGSNVFCHIHSKYMNNKKEIMRIIPRENEQLNQTWLSDRDRFSYEGLKHNRLLEPMVKKNGVWEAVTWQFALDLIVDKLSHVINQHGASKVLGLISPNASLEEAFMFQEMLRSIGVNNIDYRVKNSNEPANIDLITRNAFTVKLNEIKSFDNILLLEAYPRRSQPLLNHYIREAANNGSKVYAVGTRSQQANYTVKKEILTPAGQLVSYLTSLAKALVVNSVEQANYSSIIRSLDNIEVTDSVLELAKEIVDSSSIAIIVGDDALLHPNAKELLAWATAIASFFNVKLQFITQGANSAGMHIAGCLPDHKAGGVMLKSNIKGKSAFEAMKQDIKAVIMHDLDIEKDIYGDLQNMKQSAFNIVVSSFVSEKNKEFADILLPCAASYESAGTVVNGFGDWQFANSALEAPESVRPAWKIYASLGALLNADIKYDNINDISQLIRREYQANCHKYLLVDDADSFKVIAASNDLWAQIYCHDYRVDNLVRNAASLQENVENIDFVLCNQNLASQYNLLDDNQAIIVQGAVKLQVVIKIDNTIADNTLLISNDLINELALVTGPISLETV
jgi:NADH-quinone oxidoreductase subunit G